MTFATINSLGQNPIHQKVTILVFYLATHRKRLAARRTEKSRFGPNPSARAPTLCVADKFWGLNTPSGYSPLD